MGGIVLGGACGMWRGAAREGLSVLASKGTEARKGRWMGKGPRGRGNPVNEQGKMSIVAAVNSLE